MCITKKPFLFLAQEPVLIRLPISTNRRGATEYLHECGAALI